MSRCICLVFMLLALAASARGQVPLPDTLSSSLGWIQADTSGISFGADTYVSINTLPSPDTAWGSPLVWSATKHLMKWQRPNIGIYGDPWFWTGSYGFFVGSNDQVFRTTNAGQTWDTTHTGIVPASIGYGGCMLSSETLILLESGNYMIRTDDSGHHWKVVDMNTVAELNSISFFDKNYGYAVGYYTYDPFDEKKTGAVCYTTNDGGNYWKLIYTSIKSNLWSVAAISQSTAIATNIRGIFRTTNYGVTWDSIAGGFPVTQGLNQIAFKGKFGYAVGFGGLIMFSSDYGVTWNKQNSPSDADLYSVAVFDSTHAIAGGVNGTIIVTSTGGLSWVGPSKENPEPLLVSPNIATDHINVSLSLRSSFSIHNILGQVVFAHEETRDGIITIDTHSWPNGAYFAVCTSGQQIASAKFVVKH